MVLSRDGKTKTRTLYLPPTIRSEIALNTMNETLEGVAVVADGQPNSFFAQVLSEGRDFWSRVRDVYCYYHPEATYWDWSGNNLRCARATPVPDEKTLDDVFTGAVVFSFNAHSYQLAEFARRTGVERRTPQQSVGEGPTNSGLGAQTTVNSQRAAAPVAEELVHSRLSTRSARGLPALRVPLP